MQENNIIGEQPKIDSNQVAEANNIDLAGEKEQSGSPFGKFKNADSLFEAYNNLQSEFTRKCQKVKELELKLNDNLSVNSDLTENISENIVENIKNNNENSVAENLYKNNTENQETDKPQYLNSDWQTNVAEFIKNNPDAKHFAKEISDVLINNKEIANLKNALDISYAMVLSKKYKPAEVLLNDEDFINSQILSNENLKNKIISNYIKQVSQQKVPPVISKTSGSYFGLQKNIPKSLEDAKKQAEQLFTKL